MKLNCNSLFTLFFLFILPVVSEKACADDLPQTTIYEIQGGIVKMKEINGVVMNLSCVGSCMALEKSRVIVDHA